MYISGRFGEGTDDRIGATTIRVQSQIQRGEGRIGRGQSVGGGAQSTDGRIPKQVHAGPADRRRTTSPDRHDGIGELAHRRAGQLGDTAREEPVPREAAGIDAAAGYPEGDAEEAAGGAADAPPGREEERAAVEGLADVQRQGVRDR